MKRKHFIFILAVVLQLGLSSCEEDRNSAATDTPEKGKILVAADESFEPVLQQQVEQYERLYPGTKINMEYLPEVLVLKKLFFDHNTRMGIITRRLTDKEEKYLIDTLHYIPHTEKIATDAIVIIINAASNDSLFTKASLTSILKGESKNGNTVVFDGLNATSAVRYVTDSLLNGVALDTSVIKAAANSQAVIDYVAANKNAIGFVGISWVGNPEKAEQVAMLSKIKIAYVQCDLCTGQPFVKPTVESIASHRYPLVRGLYYVLKENFMGLGTGFSSFLQYEKGQLIFRRSYLRPVMDFDIRDVRINKTLPK